MPCRTASPGIMISRGPDVDTHVGRGTGARSMREGSTMTCSVARERDAPTWNTIGGQAPDKLKGEAESKGPMESDAYTKPEKRTEERGEWNAATPGARRTAEVHRRGGGRAEQSGKKSGGRIRRGKGDEE